MRSFALAAAAALAGCASALTLDPFVVVRSTNESDAMRLCIQDLERDLYTTTGVAPIFLSGPPAPNSLPAQTTVIYFGTTAQAPWLSALAPEGCFSGWESHCVVALPAGAAGTNGYSSIVATGTGLRGAIFGAYTFSDQVLGFKPMFLFTDTPAPYVGAANVVVNDTLSIFVGPPKYDYRAFFVNDEDLSGVHRQDPLGKNVMDLAAWDVFFQTALRNKANAFLVGTNPFPDDTATAMAARRGIVVSHHHYDLLGSNVFSWPLPSDDWDWSTNAGTMAYMWRASIAGQASYEVVWSVGMRGLNDYAYPACASGKPPAVCGAAVSEAMGNQTAWLRSTPGQANATIILYMWDELLELLAGGYLTIPDGVSVVFTDAGSGYVRTDGNWTQYAAGCYYHTAMLDGTANQLTEMVPVSRVAAQLINVITQSKSTKVFVDNISDLKPVPMTTQAVYELVWDPTPWNTTQDWNATARAFYARFGRDYAGLSAADSVTYASMWEGYFNVPYIFAGNSDNVLGSYLTQAAQSIAKDWATGKGVSTGTINTINGHIAALNLTTALPLLQQLNASAWALLPSVPAHRRGFYTSHVLLQFATQLAAVSGIVTMAQAASALAPSTPGGPVPNPAAGMALVASALAGMDTLLSLRRVTEGDAGAWASASASPVGPLVNIPAAWPLRSYYLADSLTDYNSCRGALNTLKLALAGPTGAPLLPVRPSVWYQFEYYQAESDVKPNWPLVNFNPQWNLATYVRSNCRVADVQAGTCYNGPDGGWFVKGSTAALTLQIMTSQTLEEPHESTRAAMGKLRQLGLAKVVDGHKASDGYGDAPLVIRYTTDGTTPTPTSPAYVPGAAPSLTSLLPAGQSSVTVTAMAWVDGVATGQTTVTVWEGR